MENLAKELIQTTSKNGAYLYDFIAEHYWEMSKEELKEVLLSVLGVCLDICCGDEDEEALGQRIVEELNNRYFGGDEDEEG